MLAISGKIYECTTLELWFFLENNDKFIYGRSFFIDNNLRTIRTPVKNPPMKKKTSTAKYAAGVKVIHPVCFTSMGKDATFFIPNPKIR